MGRRRNLAKSIKPRKIFAKERLSIDEKLTATKFCYGDEKETSFSVKDTDNSLTSCLENKVDGKRYKTSKSITALLITFGRLFLWTLAILLFFAIVLAALGATVHFLIPLAKNWFCGLDTWGIFFVEDDSLGGEDGEAFYYMTIAIIWIVLGILYLIFSVNGDLEFPKIINIALWITIVVCLGYNVVNYFSIVGWWGLLSIIAILFALIRIVLCGPIAFLPYLLIIGCVFVFYLFLPMLEKTTKLADFLGDFVENCPALNTVKEGFFLQLIKAKYWICKGSHWKTIAKLPKIFFKK